MFLLNIVLKILFEGNTLEIPIFEVGYLFLEGHFSNPSLEATRQKLSVSRPRKRKPPKVLIPCCHRQSDEVFIVSEEEAMMLYSADIAYFNEDLRFEEGSLEHLIFTKLVPKMQKLIIIQQKREWIEMEVNMIHKHKSEEFKQKEIKRFYEMQFNELQINYLAYHLGIDDLEYLMEEGEQTSDQDSYERKAMEQIIPMLAEAGFIKLAESEEMEEESEEEQEVEEIAVNVNEIFEQDEAETLAMEDIVEEMKQYEDMKTIMPKSLRKKYWKRRRRQRKIMTEQRYVAILVMMIWTSLDQRTVTYKRKSKGEIDCYFGAIYADTSTGRKALLAFEFSVVKNKVKIRHVQDLIDYLKKNIFDVKWIMM